MKIQTKLLAVVCLATLTAVTHAYAFYNPSTGRWLSRDPAGQFGGANPYAFAKNNTLWHYDILGLWNADVHQDRTIQWAGQVGVDQEHSIIIGVYDNGIDSDYSTYNFDDWDWGWHFNRSLTGDSRLKHRDIEVLKARMRCTNPTDDAHFAAEYLGRALHPLQDWVAHGDFNRKSEMPSFDFYFWEYPFTWHNYAALIYTGGLYGPSDPDNAEMDANGPDGRATIDTLQGGFAFYNGGVAMWTGFHGGHQRINTTESLTKDLLRDFQRYVREHGKPCGECQKAFLGSN
jgi:hypothetical protein